MYGYWFSYSTFNQLVKRICYFSNTWIFLSFMCAVMTVSVLWFAKINLFLICKRNWLLSVQSKVKTKGGTWKSCVLKRNRILLSCILVECWFTASEFYQSSLLWFGITQEVIPLFGDIPRKILKVDNRFFIYLFYVSIVLISKIISWSIINNSPEG
jgi:hypothetical protein